MAKYAHDWTLAYLGALREIPVIRHACEVAGVDRSTAWRLRESNEEFAKDEQEAIEAGVDRAEQEAFRRAVVGFEEPVVDKGRLAYRYERYVDEAGVEGYRPVLDDMGQPVPLTVRKHSDALLALYLKGRRKRVYADRTELTGADGGALKLNDETARSARVAQLLAIAKQRKIEENEFGDLA